MYCTTILAVIIWQEQHNICLIKNVPSGLIVSHLHLLHSPKPPADASFSVIDSAGDLAYGNGNAYS